MARGLLEPIGRQQAGQSNGKRIMWRSMLKVAAATAAYGVVHSFNYEAYLNSGVSFDFPSPALSGIQLTSIVANMKGDPQ